MSNPANLPPVGQPGGSQPPQPPAESSKDQTGKEAGTNDAGALATQIDQVTEDALKDKSVPVEEAVIEPPFAALVPIRKPVAATDAPASVTVQASLVTDPAAKPAPATPPEIRIPRNNPTAPAAASQPAEPQNQQQERRERQDRGERRDDDTRGNQSRRDLRQERRDRREQGDDQRRERTERPPGDRRQQDDTSRQERDERREERREDDTSRREKKDAGDDKGSKTKESKDDGDSDEHHQEVTRTDHSKGDGVSKKVIFWVLTGLAALVLLLFGLPSFLKKMKELKTPSATATSGATTTNSNVSQGGSNGSTIPPGGVYMEGPFLSGTNITRTTNTHEQVIKRIIPVEVEITNKVQEIIETRVVTSTVPTPVNNWGQSGQVGYPYPPINISPVFNNGNGNINAAGVGNQIGGTNPPTFIPPTTSSNHPPSAAIQKPQTPPMSPEVEQLVRSGKYKTYGLVNGKLPDCIKIAVGEVAIIKVPGGHTVATDSLDGNQVAYYYDNLSDDEARGLVNSGKPLVIRHLYIVNRDRFDTLQSLVWTGQSKALMATL